MLLPTFAQPSVPAYANHSVETMTSAESISYSTQQHSSSSNLISIPLELRYAIWQALVDSVHAQRNASWFKKPINELIALSLTCRQFHHELLSFRTQNLVPMNGFHRFYLRLISDLESAVPTRYYRSLTIQFDFDASEQQYSLLANALFGCRFTLEELNLSFLGLDKCGISTNLHDCAYIRTLDKNLKLVPDGQHIDTMVPMLTEIIKMKKLRILVLSNLNVQLFGRCFTHKSQLEYLHITADPRSAVHTNFNTALRLAVLAPPIYTMPVRVLHVCANSMLNAVIVPVSCAATLEHLTWTIPNASLGSNVSNAPLFLQTLQLINFLCLHAPRLKTLRICVAGNGNSGNTRTQEINNIRVALTSAVTALRNLRNFELHVPRKITFRDQKLWSRGLLDALPPRIERFYTNDQLVLPQDLHGFVTEKYLSATTGPAQPITTEPIETSLDHWHPKPPSSQTTPKSLSEDDRPKDTEQFKLWINPNSYSPRYSDGDPILMGVEISRSCRKQKWSNLFHPSVIGEDHRRKDFIPLHTGDLKFVAYEFSNPEYLCQTGVSGETLTHMMLRLNGRLLDRERNKHLATYGANQHIPLTFTSELEMETALFSADPRTANMLWKLHEPWRRNHEKEQCILQELMGSQFRDDEIYFGREAEAYNLFWDEKPAKPESMKDVTYPCVVDTEQGEQCRWMCPDADVPTLAQLDRAKAKRRE